MASHVAIRNLTIADRDETNTVMAQAFPGINPAGIVERELELAPDTCFVATISGTIAGMVCAVQYDSWAYIGPMAVAPEHQGKGVGRLLFEHLVETLEARACGTMMLDATDAGEPLYKKFGFAEWARTGDYSRRPGRGIRPPLPLENLDAALTLDLNVFGVNRALVFQRYLEREGAALYGDSKGYLMAQSKLIGPFAALNAHTAEQLFDRALNDGAVASRILAPVENRDAGPMLLARGFELQREVKHMRRGQPAAMRRDVMYGLTSFALG
jgi:predicted N-acetyltransferase YhbS